MPSNSPSTAAGKPSDLSNHFIHLCRHNPSSSTDRRPSWSTDLWRLLQSYGRTITRASSRAVATATSASKPARASTSPPKSLAWVRVRESTSRMTSTRSTFGPTRLGALDLQPSAPLFFTKNKFILLYLYNQLEILRFPSLNLVFLPFLPTYFLLNYRNNLIFPKYIDQKIKIEIQIQKNHFL